MDAPEHNEEKREVASRPLSPTLLDSHAYSWADPPLSDYNQPQYPPDLYNTPIRYTSHHTRPIQPFRRYNYLDAQGEDLGSRQYTLGPDNNWEFTSVCAPSDIFGLPPAVTTHSATASTVVHDPPVPGPDHQDSEPTPPMASGSNMTLDMLPPSSPNESRSSPETPVTPGPETGPIRRARRSSSGKKVWGCEPCDKTFYRKAEYDRHINTATIHQQERRFKCRYCGDGFTRADARGRHERMCPNNSDSGGSSGRKGKEKEKEKERSSSTD
ncbi:hypothetical protein OPQ81_008683 [Rhizoctonia solani]|nr:hypothetical protein OPQ81_008683 [Rhizoctonia solani]